MLKDIIQFDHDILFKIQNQRIELLDGLFFFISLIATYFIIALILGVGIQAWIKKSKKLLYQFYFLAISEIICALSIYSLKISVNRPRPYLTFPDIQKLGSGGSMSFPSGHTTEAFCMAWAFVLTFPTKPSYKLLFIWASLVAYSRMILGVHYPFDVLAGIIYGSLIAWVLYTILKKYLLKA